MISADITIHFDDNNATTRSATVAATVHFPSADKIAKEPIVVFALPGAGYNRRYFNLQLPGHEGYSQSEYHTAQGIIFVAIECVGAGDSYISNEEQIDFGTIAFFHDKAVSEICRQLTDGSIHPSLPPLATFRKIGLGQSLGGAVTLFTQSRHKTFEAICALGISAIDGVLPQPEKPASDSNEGGDAEIDWAYAFHSDDTPKDIVDLDLAGGYPQRAIMPSFGTLRFPACTFDLLAGRSILLADAARIDVPVFIGLGDRDSAPDPRAEVPAYSSSNDISLLIVPRMSHMHNFACTRHILWRRLEQWWTLLDKKH